LLWHELKTADQPARRQTAACAGAVEEITVRSSSVRLQPPRAERFSSTNTAGPVDMNPALTKSLDMICKWLEQTALSQTIQATNWVVPAVQSIHILAIAVVAASALMIDLRLIGAFGADQPLKDVSSRFLPFVWWPLLILLATGAIMIVGEPPRSLKNPAFQLKMALLVAAVIVTAVIQFRIKRNPAFGDRITGRRGAASTIAVLSMLLWSSIIFAGRWIAYYS
jgi:hypothetical protein